MVWTLKYSSAPMGLVLHKRSSQYFNDYHDDCDTSAIPGTYPEPSCLYFIFRTKSDVGARATRSQVKSDRLCAEAHGRQQSSVLTKQPEKRSDLARVLERKEPPQIAS